VNHYQIPYSDAVHVAMNLFDRYYAVTKANDASNHVSKKKSTTTTVERTASYPPLQLLMIGSLYLALKLTSKKPIPSALFAALTHGRLTAIEVEAMEAKLLHALDWLVHPPTSREFVHDYVLLLILAHEQEQHQQQQRFIHFDARRHRGTVADGTLSCIDKPGGSYITPVSGPIQFHYGMFSSDGEHGYNKPSPTYRDVMKSVLHTACSVLDTTASQHAFGQFKPSAVACAALFYAMQCHEDDGHFYHIYHHYSFPNPLEQLHRHGVMVNAVESSKCIESIYLLFEGPPPPPAIPAQEQQSETSRLKKEECATKRTTSPHNVLEQLDAVDDP
jgi:Cyclin, N-terminal domain/Cyclin, C-terminal domain